jgi:hypothetical protein
MSPDHIHGRQAVAQVLVVLGQAKQQGQKKERFLPPPHVGSANPVSVRIIPQRTEFEPYIGTFLGSSSSPQKTVAVHELQ